MKLRWKTFAITSVAVFSLVGILLVVSQTIMMDGAGATLSFVVVCVAFCLSAIFLLEKFVISARAKAEAALEESEDRLRQLIEYAPDAIYINDLQGNFIDGNKQAEALIGFKKEELVGKNMLEVGVLPEKYVPKVMEDLMKNLQGEKTGPDEYELIRRDGSSITVEISTFPVGREGKVEVVGIARDITDRKQIEKKLRESEEKLRNTIESSPDAITLIDMDGKIVECNQAALEMFAYAKKEEMIGKDGFLAVSSKDRAKVMRDVAKLPRKGSIKNIEVHMVAKDGREFVAEASASIIKDALGNPRYIVMLVRDVTELRKTTQELQRFSAAVRASVDGIVMSDLNGTIIEVNDAALRFYGVEDKGDLMGKSALDIVPPEERENIAENMKEVMVEGYAKSREINAFAKSGASIPVEITTTLVKDEESHPVGFLGIIRDVTERKQMLKKLEEYSQQLEKMVEERTKQLKDTQEQLVKAERLAAIGQVAAMVGHDLRNPLTGISGAAYYLKMKLGPKAEKKMTEMLEIIERDIQYSNKIITDLIEYSRDMKLKLTETTPKSIIAESVSLVQIPRKVQLTVWTLNEPRIKIDVDRMKRVFANFVKNAVEAMPQGGKLTISSRASDGAVEFMFIDTGVGIAKEVSEKIWTPFFTTKAKGMGLGLAICRRIIEAHQGKISVESIVGEGTTFTVAIPLEPRPEVEGGEKVWVNMPESLLSTTTKA